MRILMISMVITHEPSLILEPGNAQCLMDDLWHAGLRPTEGTGSAGSLAATQKHLEDMRTLVFDKTIVAGKDPT